ncbi:YagK/YfjJ domain-containing protein [Cupriavidus sp.]|uniref:YagK/YfjJ domain-containing protein n=1 Tax=Cupriavidus sp. TaxID=1873897 RepID=UPI003D098F38
MMNSDINLYVIKTKDKYYTLPYFMDGIVDLMRFMNLVVYSDVLLNEEAKGVRGASTKRRASPLEEHVERLYGYSQLYSTGYTFSPLIEFFFEQYRKHPIKDYAITLDQVDLDGSDSKLVNDFVTVMRRESLASKLRKKIYDWNAKFDESRKRMVDFEAELFRRYARLMVVRLDFNYHKSTFAEEELRSALDEALKRKERDLADYLTGTDISVPGAIEGRIALEEVQKDRDRFFGNMKGKPSLFKHLVGYIWRIEYTRFSGYHMHVMLFFDGAYVQKHEDYAQKSGEYWRDVITKGRGYFENCNRKREKYGDDWALGQVDHWDAEKRGKLLNAMGYFSKTSQIVHVMPYPKCRLFQSVFVRRQRRVKGGRPRTRGLVGADNQPSVY